ncbi:MAG: glycosyltransferase family 4 protein [Bacteroidia bacterium]|nr:glycosyltransferase family 4 protein [Bacteroidia bacterium]
MKVLYIHQYFKTPEEGGSLRSYYLAKALVSVGLEVEMITAHARKKYIYREIDGIRVHYLPVYYDNSLGFWGRIYAFAKFLVLSYRCARKIRDVSLCYASSTPLTVGLVALGLRARFGLPYFFEVRDLWPEAPIQMGVIRNRLLKNLLCYLEKKFINKPAHW